MTTQLDTKEIDCPHCKGKIDVEIERKPAKVKIEEQPVTELDAIIERALEKRMPKEPPKADKDEKPKPQVEVRMPSWMPGEYCASGNCGADHKNKHYAQKPKKKCSNCDQFAPEKAKKCAWCKGSEFDDLDDDDLAAIGIPDPVIEEHEHHHEH